MFSKRLLLLLAVIMVSGTVAGSMTRTKRTAFPARGIARPTPTLLNATKLKLRAGGKAAS